MRGDVDLSASEIEEVFKEPLDLLTSKLTDTPLPSYEEYLKVFYERQGIKRMLGLFTDKIDSFVKHLNE